VARGVVQAVPTLRRRPYARRWTAKRRFARRLPQIPTKFKLEYGLQTEFAEFYRRAAGLFGEKPLL